MAMQDETSCDIKAPSVFESIMNAPPPPSSNVKIHRVPRTMARELKDEHDKYYVPKVVSIGPYHFGDPKLELIEKLKPVFAKKLFSNKEETLKTLCERLIEPNMVQKLRGSYEENSTNKFCEKVFTRMMLLDACFILYYIKFFSGGKHRDYQELTSHQIVSGGKHKDSQELKSHQVVFVQQDLFLLENQIPFEVIKEVMKEIMPNGNLEIKNFINNNILTSIPERRWYESLFCCGKDQSYSEKSEDHFNNALNDCDHLLRLLHYSLTKNSKVTNESRIQTCTFRNVSELVDVGINFKPSGARSLDRISYHPGRWFFSANIELPSISVDDSTKPMLLNLIAYEMCSDNAHDSSWVTSYICLLDHLIDHPEDVRTLRKAGVLENNLGSDQEVAIMFNEIGTDLVPNSLAYVEAKNMIQQHYISWRNTTLSQLRHEYVNSPWAFIALVGAVLALSLSAVQTYFTVWSPEGQCDDLCMFLKLNHHL